LAPVQEEKKEGGGDCFKNGNHLTNFDRKGRSKMKNVRLITNWSSMVVFVLTLLFFNANEVSAQKKFMSIATGTTTGAYFALGGGISKLVKDKMPGYELAVESTAGSIANLRLLTANKVDIAFAASDMTYYAKMGMEQFQSEGKEKYKNLRGLSALYQEVIQVVTLEGSPIEKLSDLKGKKVAVGAAGSGTMLAARLMLRAAGLTFDDIKPDYLNMGDAANALADHNNDAGFFWSGLPTSSLLDLSALNKIKIISIDDATMANILRDWPFYSEYNVPAGTYSGYNKNGRCVASPGLLVVNSAMSEDIAYQLTKMILENTDILKTVHVRGGDIKLQTAFVGMSVPLHPGSAKYYRERGVQIPDALLLK
jgi:uncharacterized protein